jgi:hypothetical protein
MKCDVIDEVRAHHLWRVDPTGARDRTLSPEEIMNKQEEPVGRKGRRLFEQFLSKVNKLQASPLEQSIMSLGAS